MVIFILKFHAIFDSMRKSDNFKLKYFLRFIREIRSETFRNQDFGVYGKDHR